MGYFSNASEGDIYEAQYCNRCVHNLDDVGCPVLVAHMLWNYEECNKPDSILHKMIPRHGVENGECFMFKAKEEE